MWQGTVLAIYIAPYRGGPLQELTEAEVVRGRGLAGDRYWSEAVDPAGRKGRQRPVTLIESEVFDALEKEYGYRLDPTTSRRNIITKGVPLNHLVDQEFQIGSAVLRGVMLCKPCVGFAKRAGVEQLIHHVLHRGGLRAEVVSEGIIRAGDVIHPVASVAAPAEQATAHS